MFGPPSGRIGRGVQGVGIRRHIEFSIMAAQSAKCGSYSQPLRTNLDKDMNGITDLKRHLLLIVYRVVISVVVPCVIVREEEDARAPLEGCHSKLHVVVNMTAQHQVDLSVGTLPATER